MNKLECTTMYHNVPQCTTCKRCGRKLKNQKAIELGMGQTCWRKYLKENNHKELFNIEKENPIQ